jgi:zinc protease
LNPYPKDDVRYVPTIDEELQILDNITVEQLHQLYLEQVGAHAGEFVVVGDVDPASTLGLVEPFLKDWNAPVPYRHIEHAAHLDLPGSSEDILTPDKASAIYLAAHDIALRDDDRNYPALRMADFLFGEAPMASRLSNRVRGKDGLSYMAGSHVMADAKDKFGQFMVFAICNPLNMKKLDAAIAEELNKFVDKGVDAKELGQAKAALLQALKVERSNDAMLAAMIGENLFVERSFSYYADLEKKIGDLTADEVNLAIRSHLAPKRLNIIRGGDFKKKG